MQKPEGHKAYVASQGICLHHLGMIVLHVSSSLARFLIEHAAQRFSEISDHMRNYALKRDALRSYMLDPNEQMPTFGASFKASGKKTYLSRGSVPYVLGTSSTIHAGDWYFNGFDVRHP